MKNELDICWKRDRYWVVTKIVVGVHVHRPTTAKELPKAKGGTLDPEDSSVLQNFRYNLWFSLALCLWVRVSHTAVSYVGTMSYVLPPPHNERTVQGVLPLLKTLFSLSIILSPSIIINTKNNTLLLLPQLTSDCTPFFTQTKEHNII
jgi:hypothetical protein